MERLVTAKEIKQADAYTINRIGLPALVLMERAALAVIEELYRNACNLDKVAVVCGYGNNGADGVAIARLLKLKGIDVTIFFVGEPGTVSDETLKQVEIAQNYNVPMGATLPTDFKSYSLIIDAIFGVGLSKPIQGDYAKTIELINQSGANVVAVDLPSGICADNGLVMGVVVKANLTITFGYKKLGLVLYPGADYAGNVITKDIGIYADNEPVTYTFQPDDLNNLLPPRANYSNKGSFGKVLVIAGADNMCGAAYLSAKAAYLSGAGLVRIYTPRPNRTILAEQLPEALITTYMTDRVRQEELIEAINWATVIVLGPGMGFSDNTYKILLTVLETTDKPLIIDADGLNALSQGLDLLKDRNYPIFITPHLGEMARLTKKDIKAIQQDLINSAQQFANQHRVTCILKDARTIVSSPNSAKVYINQSGNNGMATGGSGDVLTGILAGLIAQNIALDMAAPVSVYLHGLAGDQAAKEKGQYSMIASNIIESLTEVMK